MLYSASINGNCSLTQACIEITESYDISYSKQGLDQRVNQKAVDFLSYLVKEQISNQIDGTIDPCFLQSFSRVTIKDSTGFDIPDRLKNYFPGYGGKITSEAGISIQYEYDIKTGKMLDLDFTSAKKTDYKDAREKMEDIQKGDLFIRDQGYFNCSILQQAAQKGAYFISKLNKDILVFDNDDQISFSKLYKKMKKDNMSHLELKVQIGAKHRLPVRLIVDIVPKQIYEARIRKASIAARKRGYNLSEEYKSRSRLNLVITNVPEQDLPGEQVYLLYKLRWQIELIFKSWKSTFGLNKIHPMSYHRFMCLIYAKMLLILISTQIINLFQRRFYLKYQKFLSKYKCFKTLMVYFYKIRQVFFSYSQKIAPLIKDLERLLSRNHWLEKRKNRVNFEDIFHLNTCISDV